MNATFHFTSAQEITPDIIDAIKRVYQEKPVSIYIQDYDPFVPEWQIQEVRRRDAITENNPDSFLDAGVVISELAKELETA
jgi:hypothetical protein